ncbi:MAG: hypothetical protein GY920_20400 [Aliivibrio sp.]|nr:hypothetical protein [Aliivibrio sp.]MCP4322173.1 hypothetical protein [Alteromonadales bacterium]
MDLSKLAMPGPAEEESMELDLEMEEGLPKEPKSALESISDEELMAEAEKRGLIEPEDMAVEVDEEIDGNPESPMLDL